MPEYWRVRKGLELEFGVMTMTKNNDNDPNCEKFQPLKLDATCFVGTVMQ